MAKSKGLKHKEIARLQAMRKQASLRAVTEPPLAPDPEDLPPSPPAPAEPWAQVLRRSLRDPGHILAVLFLIVVTGLAVNYLLPSVSRTWFYNSDEYVVVGEIIRFTGLDFHQHFFDMPGTPFILFVAAVWTLFGHVAAIFLPASTTPGIVGFTFQHLDWLFHLARATTLFFYALSFVLCFRLASRVLNPPAACLATLILAMSGAYAGYSSFVRVESMSMCLILGAILFVTSGLQNPPETTARRPGFRDRFLIAGVLTGIAAGVRMHSMMASLPLLWLVILLHQRPARLKYSRWVRRCAWFAVPALAVAGVVGFLYAQSPTRYPHAVAMLQKAALLAAVAPLLAAAAYRWERLRPIVLFALPPEWIKLGLGFAAGIILAIPTLIPQGKYYLMSMEMYSTGYKDFYRVPWPYFKDLRWLVDFYLKVAVPDRMLFYLLIAGILLILLTRSRALLPYLCAVIFFFFSKPIDLTAAPHHVILWLPFYAIICAYPLGLACSWLWDRFGFRSVIAPAAMVLSPLLALAVTNGPKQMAGTVADQEIRLQNVANASAWMIQHTKTGDAIANAYYCFDPGVFFAWLRDLEVPVPDAFLDGRDHFPWWVRQSELAGRAGFACASTTDVESVKRDINPADAQNAADPYHDPRYQLAASFGREPHRIDVFRFDFSTRTNRR